METQRAVRNIHDINSPSMDDPFEPLTWGDLDTYDKDLYISAFCEDYPDEAQELISDCVQDDALLAEIMTEILSTDDVGLERFRMVLNQNLRCEPKIELQFNSDSRDYQSMGDKV